MRYSYDQSVDDIGTGSLLALTTWCGWPGLGLFKQAHTHTHTHHTEVTIKYCYTDTHTGYEREKEREISPLRQVRGKAAGRRPGSR